MKKRGARSINPWKAQSRYGCGLWAEPTFRARVKIPLHRLVRLAVYF